MKPCAGRSHQAQGPRDRAENHRMQLLLDLETLCWTLLVRSTYSEEKGGAVRTRAKVVEQVKGRRCKFSVSPGERLVLRFDDSQGHMKARFDCAEAAAERAPQPGERRGQAVAWTAVEAWADAGKRLSCGEDPCCQALRYRICRLLWDNAAAINAWGHMPISLVLGNDMAAKKRGPGRVRDRAEKTPPPPL